MVAIPLLFGTLTAEHYEDKIAADPRIDQLRNKMQVIENKQYSIDYLDPEKRSIANAIQIHFTDGTASPRVEIHYPIGHRRRRKDAIPLLQKKFHAAVSAQFSHEKSDSLLALLRDEAKLDQMPVEQFMALWTK
jgi:2-methylcitrate dehydratase PrpD